MGACTKALAATLGLSLLCSAPSALADDTSPKATALAEAAAARARQGELRVAIDLYEEAHAISPRREYLREIGALYDTLALAGDSRDVRLALLYLERSLVDEAQTPERTAVEARLARLRLWKSRMRSEPQLPRPSEMPVHFISYKPENTYQVQLGPARCTTPCTILAPPGPAVLRAEGSGKIEQQFIVPGRPMAMRLQHTDDRRFIAGAVLVPSGLVMGASMWAFALACRDTGCVITNVTLWPVLGGSALITGIVLLALGRGTPPVDANRVDLVAQKRPSVRLTSIGLAPMPGGAGGGFEVEF